MRTGVALDRGTGRQAHINVCAGCRGATGNARRLRAPHDHVHQRRNCSAVVVCASEEHPSTSAVLPPWKLSRRATRASKLFDSSPDTQDYLKSRVLREAAGMSEAEFDERFALLQTIAPGFEKWKGRTRVTTIVGMLRDVKQIPARMVRSLSRLP